MAAQGVLGLLCFTALAWLLSENRGAARLTSVIAALALQSVLALMMLKLPPFQALFLWLNKAILALETATRAGTAFVFGFLGGGPPPYAVIQPDAGFVLAFRALPLVLVISALSALLFHWKVLPVIVRGFAWLLQRTLNIGGALGLAAAANIFVGMVEAPLIIRPYLAHLTRAELFAVMTCGMATIAGTVMVLYASILSSVLPDALGQILTASLISVPAALMIAHLMVPETGPATTGNLAIPRQARSSMDALTQGTVAGMRLLVTIVAMLVVFVALVELVNQLLGALPTVGGDALSLQRLLGWLMAPVAWLMGIPWREAATAGQLLGIKTVLNELLAYLKLAQLPADALSPSSRLILVYALCGFANFGSLGILLGGMTSLVPERRAEIVELGLKSIVAGTLATCMTGALIGLLA
jgi:CNT family concentrative nucleoside transporter